MPALGSLNMVLKSSLETSTVHCALPASPLVQVGGFAVQSTVHSPPPSPEILKQYTAFSSRALSGNCLRPSGTRLSNSSCASLGNVAMCVLRRACYRGASLQSTLTAENADGPG